MALCPSIRPHSLALGSQGQSSHGAFHLHDMVEVRLAGRNGVCTCENIHRWWLRRSKYVRSKNGDQFTQSGG